MAARRCTRHVTSLLQYHLCTTRVTTLPTTTTRYPDVTMVTTTPFRPSSSSTSDYNINLTPSQLRSLLPSCHVIDVREPGELVNEFPLLPGARNIPLGELSGVIDSLPTDNVVFICRAGVRSVPAVAMGIQAGMRQPKHLEGGMRAWHNEFDNNKPTS